MKCDLDYYSERYKLINWSSIVYECNKRAANNTYILLSEDNYSLIPIASLEDDNKFYVNRDNEYFELNDEMKIIPHANLESCGFYILKIDRDKTCNRFSDHDCLYLDMCRLIITKAYDAARCIFHYTVDHLSNRQAEDILIIHHESIQLMIAKIICEFKSIDTLMPNIIDLSEIKIIHGSLVTILYSLTRLGGGRTILKGNVQEIMYHLRLFKYFYLK